VKRIGNAVKEWRWPSRRSLELLHEEAIAEHGGAPGLRDANALNGVLAQLIQNTNQSECDIAQLAARYASGLIKNHAFVDGNKRAAFLGMGLFLFLNGYRLTASQIDATRTIFGLAANELNEIQFTEWLRGSIARR
jgi:death on curing protein